MSKAKTRPAWSTMKVSEVFEQVVDDNGLCQLPDTATCCGFTPSENPAIPTEHKGYIFRKDILRDVLAFLRIPNGDALYITGPTGSGKTSVVTEIAARLHWPVQQITMNGRFEFSQLKGQFTLVATTPGQAPEMKFIYGPLATAMKCGHILLLNEIDLADPSELSGLNDVLEGRPLVISENRGEIIKPHPAFRVIATGNSNGAGDVTGLYQGVVTQNLAAMDRYRMIHVDYPIPCQEKMILKAVSTLPEEIMDCMISLANEIRRLFRGDGRGDSNIAVTMSTRTLVRWAHLATTFRTAPNPLKTGLTQALLLRASAEDRDTIDNLAKTTFGSDWEK